MKMGVKLCTGGSFLLSYFERSDTADEPEPNEIYIVRFTLALQVLNEVGELGVHFFNCNGKFVSRNVGNGENDVVNIVTGT